jgi:hypothetical protein
MTPITISMMFWCADGKALKRLQSSLKKERISSFFTRGNALIAHFEADEEGFFELPPCVRNTEAQSFHKNSFICLQEKGDGKRHAQIVCGINGERIPYLFIKKNVVNFSVKEAMLVSAENNGDNTVAVKIESFKMETKRDGVELKWSPIFDGQCSKSWFDDDVMNLNEIQSIPDDILRHYFAVRAAAVKSIRGRVRPHYIPGPDKQPKRIHGFFIPQQAIASRCLV